MQSVLVRTAGALALLATAAAECPAVQLRVDYTYDTSGFFGAGNPGGAAAGAQARASLEFAVGFYGLLGDTLAGIDAPPAFASATFNGVASWSWQLTFANPATTTSVTLPNESIATDEFRLYVGARSLGGNVTGTGDVGGYAWQTQTNGGGFTASEISQLNAITSAFSNVVARRGQLSGFARWGGAMAFDSDASTTWHYDPLTPPPPGTTDFYSTALHVIAHTLGFGTSDEWQNLAGGPLFQGAHATAENGGPVLLDTLDQLHQHWAEGTMSRLPSSMAVQEAALDPTLALGARKHLTRLDWAGLQDIGWQLVPEPSSMALGVIALAQLAARRRR